MKERDRLMKVSDQLLHRAGPVLLSAIKIELRPCRVMICVCVCVCVYVCVCEREREGDKKALVVLLRGERRVVLDDTGRCRSQVPERGLGVLTADTDQS